MVPAQVPWIPSWETGFRVRNRSLLGLMSSWLLSAGPEAARTDPCLHLHSSTRRPSPPSFVPSLLPPPDLTFTTAFPAQSLPGLSCLRRPGFHSFAGLCRPSPSHPALTSSLTPPLLSIPSAPVRLAPTPQPPHSCPWTSRSDLNLTFKNGYLVVTYLF